VAIVAGIDEAGYGPLLGPLVVSAAVFHVPDELVDVSMWELLNNSTTAKPSRRRNKLAIADSKKLYRRPADLVFLERVVLATLCASAGQIPTSLDNLLQIVSPDISRLRQNYAWYNHSDPPLPVSATGDEIRLAAKIFGRDMEDCSLKLHGLLSAPLLEGEYNAMVAQTRNKATVLLARALSLVQQVLQTSYGEDVLVYIDRQGGRITYRRALLQAFEQYDLTVRQEDKQTSSYLLQGSGNLRLQFLQGGEQRHMLIALASITSKYLRELFMRMYNTFWQAHLPNLKRTAGYWQDGQRFLAEIEPVITKLGIDKSTLVRRL